jgi:hypothetical protein
VDTGRHHTDGGRHRDGGLTSSACRRIAIGAVQEVRYAGQRNRWPCRWEWRAMFPGQKPRQAAWMWMAPWLRTEGSEGGGFVPSRPCAWRTAHRRAPTLTY